MSPTEQTLAASLIRCRSVSPEDDGAQRVLADKLRECGFRVEDVTVSGVRNLWAERPGSPMLAFVVHTDVVPEGYREAWSAAPFAGEVRDGFLWGRGAVDMKGEIGCAVAAVEDFLRDHPDPSFGLAFFATGDEETGSNYGADGLLDHLEATGRRVDFALVTEPSSAEEFGDSVKIGRRGSFHGHIEVRGEQRHSSHADQSVNPIRQALPLMAALADTTWCGTNAFFPTTSFQFTRVAADAGATNVTPGMLEVEFNLRFSSELTSEDIARRVEGLIEEHAPGARFTWHCNARPFLTEPGAFSELVREAVADVTGKKPAYSTAGGTSDGRFLAARGIPVVECGPVGILCHQVDERISLEEMARLTRVYRGVLDRFNTQRPT